MVLISCQSAAATCVLSSSQWGSESELCWSLVELCGAVVILSDCSDRGMSHTLCCLFRCFDVICMPLCKCSMSLLLWYVTYCHIRCLLYSPDWKGLLMYSRTVRREKELLCVAARTEALYKELVRGALSFLAPVFNQFGCVSMSLQLIYSHYQRVHS